MTMNTQAIKVATPFVIAIDLIVVGALTWRLHETMAGFLEDPDLILFMGVTLAVVTAFVAALLLFVLLTGAFFMLAQTEYGLIAERTPGDGKIDADEITAYAIVVLLVVGEPLLVLAPLIEPMVSNQALLGGSGVGFFEAAPEIVLALAVTAAHVFAARLTAKKICVLLQENLARRSYGAPAE